jgi:hypothetical protein
MTQEVLKLALEALETELSIDWTNNDEFNASAEKMYEAITAIKEALAQEKTLQALHSENERLGLYKDAYAEQEPVAVVDVHEFYDNCANFSLLQKLPKGKHTLYTTSPQRTWVGLTDEEIEQLHTAWVLGGGFRQLCNAIEAKLKKRNT